MATDYLESMFPSYALTQDTTVVPLKNYYCFNGGVYKRVLDAVATDNPHTKGWYQRTANHVKEYQFNLQSYQMNNIANICHGMGNKMLQFPKHPLPRQTTDGIVTLDWRSSFFDTFWDEMVGDCLAPEGAMPFKVSMFFAANLNELVRKISSRENYTALLEQFMTLNPEPEVHGKNYREQGYLFDASTVGSTSRTDDTYTCVVMWSEIDTRAARLILQNEAARADSRLLSVLAGMDGCTRTLVDLALRVASIRVETNTSFICRTISVPPRFTFNKTEQYRDKTTGRVIDLPLATVELYRLCFRNQLVANAKYGAAFVDGVNNLVIPEIRAEENPTAKFIAMNLPEYSPSLYPVEQDELYNFVQDGNVWFTNIPFNGVV